MLISVIFTLNWYRRAVLDTFVLVLNCFKNAMGRSRSGISRDRLVHDENAFSIFINK